MKESEKKMMQHSEIKVRLLKLYLERYLNILSNSKYVGDIHVYDLFCGEGIYEDGGKGSPLIILETIKNIHFASKATGRELSKFNCLFNDIDNGKVKKVEEYISKNNLHYPEIGKLNFRTEDYRKLLQEVIGETEKFKKRKAFVFIDPYGYKDIKVADINSLLQNGSTEVLLFLPTQFMFRFETKGTPESLKEFINELMPIEKWPTSETGIEFIENLREAFREALGDDYFVDSFIITRDKNQFFCLFFFTSHIYGFDRMLDAKWKIDEEEGRGWQFNVENTLFSQVEKKPNTYKFERILLEYLKKERTNEELYQFTLHAGHLPSHANEILLKLQNEQKLLALKKDGSPARKSSFYLNYKSYKEEPDKISLKLK